MGDGGHVSADRRDPAETLSRALVAVVEANGWHVAGGLSESAPPDRTGRCVPRG